jgi:LPXTG-motif cell wall-anchored protein
VALSRSRLPFTGSQPAPLAILGLLMLAGGLLLRRRPVKS